MPPSDPAAVPPPEDEIRRTLSGPAWDASRERAASESAAYFAANPPEAPPPEWAVEMAFAHTFPADYKAYGYAKARDVWKHLEGTSDWRRMYTLARLLASVREAAIRQAADTVCAMPVPVAFAQHGIMGVARMAAADAILSLLHTPPSGGAG